MPKSQTKKKPGKLSRGRLVKLLDSLFSQWFRKSQADKNGICECYTCGKRDHWKKMQTGHFITRAVYALRWIVDNVRVQCFRCNCILSGNYVIYTSKMIKEVGEKKVDEMIAMRNKIVKIETSYIQEQIEYYKSLQ